MGNKLFSYVIGNPPYQQETSQGSATNGQRSRKNVFHHFQKAANQLADKSSVLIYPGGRWLHQSGKGLSSFGKQQINDCHLSKVIFYPNAKELFPSTDISDGITIVIMNYEKTVNGFEYIYSKDGEKTSAFLDNPGEDLIPLNPDDFSVLGKIDDFVNKHNLRYLHDYILPRSLFGIESDFVEKHPEEVCDYDENEHYNWSEQVKVFTNDKAGAAGRSKWFVADRKIVKQNTQYVSEWQVVVSSAHAGGQEGRDNQMTIIDDKSVFGRARVALASFKTELEAENFVRYASSKIIKYAFLMSDEALSSLGKRVPDLIDYANNSLIDFKGNIDAQLSSMMNLTDAECEHISQCLLEAERKDEIE